MVETIMKACSKCGSELPTTAEYFYRNRATKDGLRYECKECHKPKQKSKRKKEKILGDYKKCTTCHNKLPANNEYFAKKKNGKYGLDSRCKKCDADYRLKHREHTKEYHRLYYIKNKEMIAERNRKWHQENKSSAITRKQRRRARKRKLTVALTEKQWNRIKNIFNNECAYCGMTENEHLEVHSEKLHREHFLPVSKDGEFTHNNIIPSCRGCNASKHEKYFFDWYPTYEHYSKTREKKILEYLGYKDEGIQQLSIL